MGDHVVQRTNEINTQLVLLFGPRLMTDKAITESSFNGGLSCVLREAKTGALSNGMNMTTMERVMSLQPSIIQIKPN